MGIGQHPTESSNKEDQDTPTNQPGADKAPEPEVLIEEKEHPENSIHRDARAATAVPVVNRGSIVANITSTLILRIASRTSFVVLSFYLGERFASAMVVALVLEAFYISELVLAPMVGSLSDRVGRKPFLLLTPLLGSGAALLFAVAALLFPHPHPQFANQFDPWLAMLLLFVLLGRLLEGAATGFNSPATLGYITDTTIGNERLRARVMTAFEIVTVGGLVLAMPFGGQVSKWLGVWGFFVVIALHLINFVIIGLFIKESAHREARSEAHGSLMESLKMLRQKSIFTFLPAWLSINALVGSWITLSAIMLAYHIPEADLRHPGQLLYGGFTKESASMIIGGFGLIFLVGMVLWTFLLPYLRRTTTMMIGLGGLALCIISLSIINSLGENPMSLPHGMHLPILGLITITAIAILLLSGFTPAALTQMADIAESQPGKRGAVMGLYSVVLGVGQLAGAFFGGFAVDRGGFYGLMIFSTLLGALSLISVLYMRLHGQDHLRKSQQT